MTEIKKFVDLKVIKSFTFMLIPLVLILFTGEFRPSISDYAYSEQSTLFTCMLTLAGFMFFEDGYVDRKRYYNMILGAALTIVAWTPHLDFPILHFSSAAIFYLGSTIAMLAYTSKKQLPLKILVALITATGLTLHFALDMYNLLVAEWIGMFPICFTFIGEATGKLD